MDAFTARTSDPGALRIFPDVPDLAAIAEVVRGNREMFEVIVRRYNQPLFRIGMAYLRDHALAEDAMQNAYVKAFQGLAGFRGGSAFSTWLIRIMINECLMLRRRNRSGSEAPVPELADAESLPGEPAATDRIHLVEMKTLLEQAIAGLPRNYRAVYMLREVQQLSVAETAACLRISTASVKVLLHRARERLKADLLKSAAGLELFGYRAERCDPMTARVMRLVLAAR
jgi:RNA polymerase sigma factor (sigma-70 family)